MKPKFRRELVKVINGLDRTLEGWPGDWVSKVSEVSLENELHIEALERGMNAALGPSEDMHNFLQFFSTYHDKIVAGWGPWKKPASTAHEARAINIAFTSYLGRSTLVMDNLEKWTHEVRFHQTLSREDMTNLAPMLQEFDVLLLQLKDELNELP